VRLVFAGTPDVALPALEAIAGSGHELVAVVTRPDAVAGRGHRLVRSPVGQWADQQGIEVLTPARPREPAFLDRLRAIARRHGVPMTENRLLARALYRRCKIGQFVPTALYDAVAVVLAFAYRRRALTGAAA
jgi:methionyl-tRNA formyltransferase